MRFLLALLVLVPSVTLAQDAPPDDPPDFLALLSSGEVVSSDVSLDLVTALERDGVREVASGGEAPSLYASVRDGAVVDWIALGADGRFLPVTPVTTTGESVAEVYYACTLAAEGAAHCWQISASADSPEQDQ
ncbi:MAG: hypothetical protein AAGI52_00845 [Bacteroidota bacterium]